MNSLIPILLGIFIVLNAINLIIASGRLEKGKITYEAFISELVLYAYGLLQGILFTTLIYILDKKVWHFYF